MNEQEIWIALPGISDWYSVSNLGRVRSTAKYPEGRILSTYLNRGYPIVNLMQDGRVKHFRVHRLVCEAFHGPCPPGHETAHLDGDRQNARSANLVWKTPKENALDRVRHGTDPAGEGSALAKLTADQVVQIRKRRKAGDHPSRIAHDFGIAASTCRQIIAGTRWRCIELNSEQLP